MPRTQLQTSRILAGLLLSLSLFGQRRVALADSSSTTILTASVHPQAKLQAPSVIGFTTDGTASVEVRMSHIVTPSDCHRVRLFVRSVDPAAGITFKARNSAAVTGTQQLLSSEVWRQVAVITSDVSGLNLTVDFTADRPGVERVQLEWRWQIASEPGL